MTRSSQVKAALATLVLLCLACGGCASARPSRFYFLSSTADAPPPKAAPSPKVEGMIQVGPIEFPDYLNRPQIVTRSGPNEYDISDFHRWAEPLKENFTRAMAINLARYLRTDSVIASDWAGAPDVTYRVDVQVIRFDGAKSKNVILIARWRVLGPDKKERPWRLTRVAEPVKEMGYPAFVAAQSRALNAFSRGVADAILQAAGER